MKYELWDLIPYAEGEPYTPFCKICDSDDFGKIYLLFLREIKKKTGSYIYK
jgi:hypothetical protein